jgi:hypothetical protein
VKSICSFFGRLVIKSRALYMLGMLSLTELSTKILVFWDRISPYSSDCLKLLIFLPLPSECWN